MSNFALLETILYTPTQGFYLLDLHIGRLLRSAAEFHDRNPSLFNTIPSPDAIRQCLYNAVPSDSTFKRVRLLLDQDLHVEYTILDSSAAQAPATLMDVIAQEPTLTVMLDSQPLACSTTDPFLRNKTTQRNVYNEARQRVGCGTENGPFDVILWNKDRQVTESSIANVAIQSLGENGHHVWKTPSVECGLLPGVFREALLANGELVEDIITVDELMH
ncbi:D-aminoacid aminotransferase-like PLP-dependent enzyme, partial [Lichtheimia hyalospora FSU 10163]